jgi:acyl homoserine lactone synthase
MIIAIDGLNKHLFQPILEDMYRLRARVFADRLGWEVNIEDGMEIDQFDRLDPGYIVGLDDDLNVISCARVLQTTGPHMLSDVFEAILDGEPPLRSSTVWESTRFCVDTQRLKRKDSAKTVSVATCELMIGILEYSQAAGIEDIITVIDPVMDRVLKRSDNAPHGYVGKTVPMGKVSALAALLDCTDDRIERVRNFAGVQHDVFLSEDEVLDRLAAKAERENAQDVPTNSEANIADLRDYCLEQMNAASSDAEREAAQALLNTLSAKIGTQSTREINRIAGAVS